MRHLPVFNILNFVTFGLAPFAVSSVCYGASDCSKLFLESKETVSKIEVVGAHQRPVTSDITYKLAQDPVPAIEEIYGRRFAAEEKQQPDRFLMGEYFETPLREILRMLEAQVVPPEVSAQAAELISIGKRLLKEGAPYGPTIRFIHFSADHLVSPKRPYQWFARKFEGRDHLVGTPDLHATIFTGFRHDTGLIIRGRTLDQLIADRNQILLPNFDDVTPRRINRLRETPFKTLGLSPREPVRQLNEGQQITTNQQAFYDISSFMQHDISHTSTLAVADQKAFPTPTENAVFLKALVDRAKQGQRFLNLVSATFTRDQATLADGYIYLRTHEQNAAMKDVHFTFELDPKYSLNSMANEGIQIPADSPRPARERLIEIVDVLMGLHRQVYGAPTP